MSLPLPWPFERDYMQLALVAGLVVGICAPLIGTFLVQKRMSLMGDGIGHVAFAGVAAGLVFGVWPIGSALLAAVAGIDADSQHRFRDSLVHFARHHGTAVLLVSHELGAVAADLDRVLVLRHGKIAFDGRPEELTATGVSLGVHQTDLPLWLEDPGLADQG